MNRPKAAILAEIAAYTARQIQSFSTNKAKSSATPKCRALAARFVATYAIGREAPADIDLDAAAMVAAHGVIELLARERDIVHLALVMERAIRLRCRDVTVLFRDPVEHLVRWRYFEETPEPHLDHHHELWACASAIAARRDESLADVRAILRPLHKAGPLAVRVWCAQALGDATWMADAVHEFVRGNKSDHPEYVLSQLYELPLEPELVDELSRAQPQSVPIAALLERYGTRVADSFIAAHAHDPNNEHATKALATIETVPAAAELARSLTKRRCAPIAKAFYARRPDLARAALEPLRSDRELGIFVKPFLDAPSLPPLLGANGDPLPEDAVAKWAALIRAGKPSSAFAEMKAQCDASSLAAFGWAIFEAWLVANAPSLEAGALGSLAHCADDMVARKLGGVVLDWANHGQNNRALAGFDVLANIGSPVARLHLQHIAQVAKNKVLQGKARDKLSTLAKERGWSLSELADRSIPDFGMDRIGALAFDVGKRRVRVAIDDDLKLASLPKGSELHRGIRDDLKLLAIHVPRRLERAMVEHERWNAARFRTYVLEHPVVARIARRLVWATYAGNAIARTFHITDDGTLADEHHATLSLPDDASIGVAARAELTSDQRSAWSERFAQYKLVQPFEQL